MSVRHISVCGAAAVLLLAACSDEKKPGASDAGGGGGDMASTGGSLTTYKVCEDGVRSGDFTVTLGKDYTGIQGTVFDRKDTNSVGVQVGNPFGDCRLMKRPDPGNPCNPVCGENQECLAGTCSPKPQPASVGDVTFSGLLHPMKLRYVAGNYINPPPALHPLFAPGSDFTLNAAGQDGYGPFSLKGFGVEALVTPEGKLRVDRGMPVTMTWTAPAKRGPGKIHINFSVNRHAATDSWFECLVEDNGSFTISAALTDELFKYGTSGFPDATLTRLSADSTTVPSGCVHLRVISESTRELDVPGIKSCKFDEDCTAPEVCRADRVCGVEMP